MKTRLMHLGIVLFCLWHMAAVSLYSLSFIDLPSINAADRPIWRIFRPYLLATSQWQQWNMFAPDPLRRVTDFRFSKLESDNTWIALDPYAFSADYELKLMRRMEDDALLIPARHLLLTQVCEAYSLPMGTVVRLEKVVRLLPYTQPRFGRAFWKEYTPTDTVETVDTYRCPALT